MRPRTNPMNKLWRRASPVAWIFPRVHTICHQLKQEQQQQKGDRTRPVGVAGNCIKGKPFSFFFLHFPAAPSRGLRFFISSWPSANERSHQTPSITKHGPRCRLDSLREYSNNKQLSMRKGRKMPTISRSTGPAFFWGYSWAAEVVGDADETAGSRRVYREKEMSDDRAGIKISDVCDVALLDPHGRPCRKRISNTQWRPAFR